MLLTERRHVNPRTRFRVPKAGRIVQGQFRDEYIMLMDRYGLPLSTTSSAARDAYVEGCEAKLTMYPGTIEAFDRARPAAAARRCCRQ